MRFVRRLGLMTLAEWARARLVARRSRAANRRFRAAHPDVVLPPERLMHDPYGLVDYAWYWESGKAVAANLGPIIDAECARNGGTIKVLEWGCGPARVVRHLASAKPGVRFELSGSDYNREAIAWCREHLRGVTLAANELAPPLPYGDNTFDFVYCLSVFTHLSEAMHHAWFAELWRIVKPGGCILLTLHGDHYRQKLLPDELRRYDAGELVVRAGVIEGARMYGAFHGERFVRERLLRRVTVVRHESADNGVAPPQDVWIVRRDAAG